MECEQVTLNDHKTASGVDFYTINPKGNVPCIVLDSGEILNENVATLSWIATESAGKIAPATNTTAHFKHLEMLALIATEYHQGIGTFFNPGHNDGSKEVATAVVQRRLTYLNDHVLKNGAAYLVDGKLSAADIYLYIVLTWCAFVGVDSSKFTNVTAFSDFIKGNAQVAAAQAHIATAPATVN